MANRIDVHSHFLPPDYLAAMRNAGIRDVDGYPLPQWTVDLSLAAMDQNGIGAAVLSVSSPALGFVDGDAARELARSANESARALITAHPDRFGAFALLPLPDVDASLREIAHALDTLGLDGVGVLTNSPAPISAIGALRRCSTSCSVARPWSSFIPRNHPASRD